MRSLPREILNLARGGLIVGYLSPAFYASLMMTSEEVMVLDSVEPRVDTCDYHETASLAPTTGPDVLFLSAILYFNSDQWTVWINGKSYTSEDGGDDQLRLKNVTQHFIELELNDALKKSAKLRTNQSLVTANCRVVDGDARFKPSVPL